MKSMMTRKTNNKGVCHQTQCPLQVRTHIHKQRQSPTTPSLVNLQRIKRGALVAVTCSTFGLGLPALASQNWSYTYNANGQVLTADGPRTDVTDITTNTYDVAGNLATTTNALGHSTQLLDYNGRGQAGRVIDANGVETILTYHTRGWLLTSTVQDPGGNALLDATTTYDYDNVGQVTRITGPEGTVLNYEYNGARQLTVVSNGLGERIEYSLDLQGNQTGESIKSDTGAITKTLSRTYDELSRLLTVVGAGGADHGLRIRHQRQYDPCHRWQSQCHRPGL